MGKHYKKRRDPRTGRRVRVHRFIAATYKHRRLEITAWLRSNGRVLELVETHG